jgi:hypothetical protein
VKNSISLLVLGLGLSSLVFAGEDLSSSYWSLGWSDKATVVSKESKSSYVRVVLKDGEMKLAYIVSGEGACASGISEFEEKGSVNGQVVNFSGICLDEYYKELTPVTSEEEALIERAFLSGGVVVFKVGKLPKRTFSSARFESTVKAVGLNVSR